MLKHEYQESLHFLFFIGNFSTKSMMKNFLFFSPKTMMIFSLSFPIFQKQNHGILKNFGQFLDYILFILYSHISAKIGH